MNEKVISIVSLLLVILIFAIVNIHEIFVNFKEFPIGKRCRIKGTARKGTCIEHVGGEFYCVLMDDDSSHLVLPIDELQLVLWEL